MSSIIPSRHLADPHRTAQAVIASQLRSAILSGRLAPGTRLRQAAIAKELRTSTTPVREAMLELAGEGLLKFDPYRGVVVHRASPPELREVYQLRMLLEPLAIEATVTNIPPRELRRAEELLREMETEKNVAEWAILDDEFHTVLNGAAEMPILEGILRKLRNISTLYVSALAELDGDFVTRAMREHWAILDACKSGDVQRAKSASVDHLQHIPIAGEGDPDAVIDRSVAPSAGD